MRLEMLEYTPLDEHEASATMTDWEAAAFISLDVTATDHVEHEGTAVVLKVRLPCLCSALHAIPVDLLLGVDTTSYVLIGSHKLEDCLTIEANVGVNEHQIVVLTLQKYAGQFVTRTSNQALVGDLAPRHIHPDLGHLAHSEEKPLHIGSSAHAPVHGGGDHHTRAFFFSHFVCSM